MTAMLRLNLRVAFVAMLLALPVAAPLQAKEAPRKSFRTIPTRYYTLSTDASDEMASEAALRMDRMFEEYTQRIRGHARPLREKMLFRLYSNSADYRADGGPAGSEGVVKTSVSRDGLSTSQLMVLISERPGQEEDTWHVMQHEGFHQFAMSFLPRLPAWVNEGLADYYATSRFVGEGFIYGRIPEHRRELLVRTIKANEHKPFIKFTTFTRQQWIADLSPRNYLQAWAMVYFLIDGEQGKYHKPFKDYMASLGRGMDSQIAWNQSFGRETMKTLEDAWKKYWIELPPNSKAALERQIKLTTMANFLVRAAKSGKKYEQFQAFFTDAKSRSVKLSQDPAIWLPPKLLDQAIESVNPSNVTLSWSAMVPNLVETQKDGTKVNVTYSGRQLASTTHPAK